MNKNYKLFLLMSLGASFLVGGTGAMAAGEAAGADSGSTIEEIVVTAQRRAQDLQDVPLSIAAYSGKELQKMGVSDVYDIIENTVGIQSQSPTGPSGLPVFNIRGVTLLDFSYTNEGSVAIYADDVYLGNPFMATQQLFDLERVELLRGPQGTLYGRNATGGLVHFVSRRPSDQFEGRIMAQYMQYDDIVLETGVSIPISDRVRTRIAARYRTAGTWQRNLFLNTKTDSVDHALGVRATVEMDLSDATLLTLQGNVTDASGNEDGRASFGRRNPANLTMVCSPADIRASRCANALGFRDPNPDPKHFYSNDATVPYDQWSVGGLAKLETELGGAKLTSISSYLKGRKTHSFDGDGAAIGSNFRADYYIRHRQISEELRLSGETDRFNWLAGAFYYHDKRFYTAQFTALRTGNYSDQKISSYAGFAQVTYKLTDALNLTGGVRYTNDKKTLEDLALVSGPVPGTRLGNVLFLTSGKITTNKVNWRAGFDWHVTPDVMVFGSASTGFKSGGYNTSLVTALSAVGPVRPETITTFELGTKSELIDRKLTVNLTGYYSIYKDIQSSATVPCTVACGGALTSNLFLNIGDSNVYGLELEMTARPVPDLALKGGVALNHNKLDSPAGVQIGGRLLDGNRLANTPRLGLSGSFEWTPSLGDMGSLSIGANAKYQSKVLFRPDNNPETIQPGYVLVGAHVGWQTPYNIAVDLFAENLLDKEYFVSQTIAGDNAPATWGAPRRYGVRVTATF